MTIRISQVDAVALLRDMRPNSVDLIITDPAYESLEKHRAIGTTTRLVAREWFPIFPNSRYPELFEAMWRALRPLRHSYIFCDDETSDVMKPIAQSVGFSAKRLIWDKGKIGMGYHYRAKYEFVLLLEKTEGKKRRQLNNRSTPDVLCVDRVMTGFPTEKPLRLIETFVTHSSNPDELVVDPFVGAGTTAEACGPSRNFVGGDIWSHAIETTRKRVRGFAPRRSKGCGKSLDQVLSQ